MEQNYCWLKMECRIALHQTRCSPSYVLCLQTEPLEHMLWVPEYSTAAGSYQSSETNPETITVITTTMLTYHRLASGVRAILKS